jgi:hypothetical protein
MIWVGKGREEEEKEEKKKSSASLNSWFHAWGNFFFSGSTSPPSLSITALCGARSSCSPIFRIVRA